MRPGFLKSHPSFQDVGPGYRDLQLGLLDLQPGLADLRGRFTPSGMRGKHREARSVGGPPS